MGMPIATKTPGYICFAFPDVVDTQIGLVTVPVPYPNIGDLGQTINFSPNVKALGKEVIHIASEIPTTSGDEPGIPGKTMGKVKFTPGNSKVFVNGQAVVRMFDKTEQNNGNAVGQVLGGVPTVLVGP